MKLNRDEILGEKTKIADKFKALETQWAGYDPEAVQALMKRIETDEDTKLMAEGRMDEVITRRTEAMRGDADTRIQAAEAKTAEGVEALKGAIARIANLVIGTAVRDAAAKSEGFLPTALPDMERRAKEVFSLGENDEIEARKPDGTLIIGKNGTDALSPADWLTDTMRTEAPHWWGISAGGGAGGNNGPGGSSDTPIKDLDKLSGRQLIGIGVRKAAQQ